MIGAVLLLAGSVLLVVGSVVRRSLMGEFMARLDRVVEGGPYVGGPEAQRAVSELYAAYDAYERWSWRRVVWVLCSVGGGACVGFGVGELLF